MAEEPELEPQRFMTYLSSAQTAQDFKEEQQAGLASTSDTSAKTKLKLLKKHIRQLQKDHDATIAEWQSKLELSHKQHTESQQDLLRCVAKLETMEREHKAEMQEQRAAQEELRGAVDTLESENTGLRGMVEELQMQLKRFFENYEHVQELEAAHERIRELENTVFLINQDRQELTEIARKLQTRLQQDKQLKNNHSPQPVLRAPAEEMAEEVWESKRWTPVLGWTRPTLPLDPNEWGDVNGHTRKFEDIKLLPGWEWKTNWKVDFGRPQTDEEGWEYSKGIVIPALAAWHATMGKLDLLKRRRWCRIRTKRLPPEGVTQSAAPSSNHSPDVLDGLSPLIPSAKSAASSSSFTATSAPNQRGNHALDDYQSKAGHGPQVYREDQYHPGQALLVKCTDNASDLEDENSLVDGIDLDPSLVSVL
eukprot:gb/GEZN01004541.1/.p1 GENE.gb/GEZN01004541.1/~~gb/GEZN01004541.1/.p1  ORF type:complete len:422 (-),score=90.05 gb/GEZN01004541.1/:664-1929(-)